MGFVSTTFKHERPILLQVNRLEQCQCHSYVTRFGKKEMRQRGLMLCKDCHAGIHDLIPDEKELADKYHTKELLLENEAIRKHIAWVKKQK